MEREYEISLWEDKDLYNEIKIATIGSDTMTAQSRALEPMMKSNMNGAHTFTFKVFYKYIDTYTGEEVMNPFLNLLVNERKVKVKWKGEWFDLVIKNCQESSDDYTITYTCSDLYMTEFGKNGFELDFSTEAKNNQGTITQLGKKVLEGTDWTLKENNKVLNQTKEEPLYKATTQVEISATNLTTGETITIAADTVVYVFYSSKEESENPIQFLYSENDYSTEENQILILNKDINYSTVGVFSSLFKNSSLSNQYRGKKLISHYETEYDPVLDKIVGVYTDTDNNEKVYGYVDYDYDAPPIVTNLVAEPKDFATMAGWHSSNTLTTKLYPEVTTSTTVAGYEGKSYLVAKISNAKPLVNKGLKSCTSYLPNGFSEGQKLYCRIKAYSTLGSSLLNNLKVSIKRRNDNFDLGSPVTVYFNEITLDTFKDGYYTGTLTCSKALDPANVSIYAGIFITNGSANESTIYLEEFQLFELIKDNEGNICYPDSIVTDQVIKPRYHYYFKTNIDDESYTPIYDAFEDDTSRFEKKKSNNPYEKIRTIEAKQSNRFNILQQLAETFQCWVRFHIDHEENGSIKIIDGVPQKFVEFVENIGEQLYYGFTYGIDLNNIQRTIVSDQITSKVIVLPNQNELAPHGTCNISTSEENYPGVNFLLDFDYYCNHGLLDAGQVNKDLYQSSDSTGLGYFVKLHQLSEKYKKLTEDENIYKAQAMTLDSYYKTYIELKNATETEKNNTRSELYNITKASSIEGINSYISKYGNAAADISTKLVAYKELEKRFDAYNDIITSVESQLDSVNSKLNIINAETEGDTSYYGINKQTDELNTAFYAKYSRFIQEGTWNSQEYIDPNLYYLDALDVAYTSSRPQVQYNVSVTRVSDLEDFKLRKFKVGDVSYIEDPEFFGYTHAAETNLKTPYREEVLISETQEYFESPDKDTVTVQNYKTQFEDLFQRITATTQSLQYNQGNYTRAANIVDDSGAIKPSILQNSLILARNIVKDSQNESIIEDNTGITLTDLRDLSKKVKIASGGILFSNDGGLTWSTLLSAGGISTNYLTSGQINTNKIIVQDGNFTTFRWDSRGINAYNFEDAIDDERETSRIYSFEKAVRFDKFGIYGFNESDYVEKEDETEHFSTEDSIWKNAKFGLTWKGFFLRNNDNSVEINSEDDFVVKDNSDKIRIKIGRIVKAASSSESNVYGIQINNSEGKTVMETADDGNLWLRKELNIGPKDNTDFIYNIYLGYKKDNEEDVGEVFNANNNFIVYADGSISALEGTFGGSLLAKNGKFGCLYAEENTVTIRPPFEVTNNIDEEGNIISTTIVYKDKAFSIQNADNEDIFYVDADGNLVTEYIIVKDGLFTGKITTKEGSIGGFDITENTLTSKNTESPIILDGVNGKISVETIELGEGATVQNYIKFGVADNFGYLYNPKNHNNIFLSANGKINIKTDGTMYIGSINMDGNNSIIEGKNWSLSPTEAIFNNITARGSLKATTFEYGTVQTVGGMLLVRPSSKIKEAVLSENIFSLKLENITGFSVGDRIIITTSPNFLYNDIETETFYGNITELDISTNVIKATFDNLEGQQGSFKNSLEGLTLTNLGQAQDNVGLFINGSIEDSNFGAPQAITVFSYDNTDNNNSYTRRIILGKIPNNSIYGALSGTYGLYADNVLLEGAMISRFITQDSDENSINFTSGINTKSTIKSPHFADSQIVLWAGALDNNIANAPFYVDSRGNLYAAKGTFEGSILSNVELRSAIIYGAEIHGVKDNALDEANALYIYNTSLGIHFLSESENVTKVDESTHALVIKDTCFSSYGKNFITIDNEKITANFNRYNFNDIFAIELENNNQLTIRNEEQEKVRLLNNKIYLDLEDTNISHNLTLGSEIDNYMRYKYYENGGYDLYINY